MADFPISRRTVLKGLGVSMALPLLDAMLPKMAIGQQAAAQLFPRRFAVVYFPHGVLTRDWTIVGTGTNYTFSKLLQPLAPFRDDIMILSGLTCDKARPHGDGTGDHARAQASFLTGKQARKSTSDINVGISADQMVAQRIGDRTRFPSLEIGCEGGRQSGGCDPGYSCAYTSNMSWRSATTPAPKETNPRAVFDRLFAGMNPNEATANRQRRERYNQSILDFVLEDARSLNNNVGLNDQRRVAAFSQVQGGALSMERPDDMRVQQGFGPAGGMGGEGGIDYQMHIRTMADLMTVAFQTDVTRVCTFVLSNEISNRSYRFIGVPEGHHDISHHGFDREKMKKVAKINLFHVEQYAYLLGRMKSITEGNGTMLDNSMVLYGSGNGDGALHNHDELPIVLAGKAGGAVTPGRHLRYARNTPICNLYLEMMDRMDVQCDSFGDSTGRLRNLS